MADVLPASVASVSTSSARFKTFQGVFRPVFLTILGAMLYLREGWLVANNGLLGAIAVILAAHVITGSTALSMASIATNVRVRPGGAFAIISHALGLEAGGAIGIPLYIAQTMSSAMYLFAFSEAWGYLFPTHDPRLVVIGAFLAVAGLAWRSAKLAFQAQGVMLVIVVAAISSAFLGVFTVERVQAPVWVARFPDASLLETFAIFFPAATGILVGAGMSGALEDPRRAIPRGTLAAWAVCFGVYLIAAVWYALVAPPDVLLAQKTVMVDRALFGPLVLIGIISSTGMAALSSLVAAPQLLQAMAAHRVVPASDWLARRSEDGEPRNAVLVSLGIGAAGLLSGSLDAIAPIVTSFFIITYLGVNLVVALEQRLGMLSFRPTFVVHPTIPVVGLVACASALVLSSPLGGAVEFLFVLAIYGVLVRRRLDTPWETVRSGIPVAIAAWAARRASGVPRSERSWKPDLLVPVSQPEELDTLEPVIRALTSRTGTTKLVGIGAGNDGLGDALAQCNARLRHAGLHAGWTHLDSVGFAPTVRLALDLLRTDLFPPNLVLVDGARHASEDLHDIVAWCHAQRVGMLLVLPDPEPREPVDAVDVWISDRSPEWRFELHQGNIDLQVLVGWLLSADRGLDLRLVTVLRDEALERRATVFLREVVAMGRLPEDTTTHVRVGAFMDQLPHAPPARLHLFGLPSPVDLDQLRAIRARAGGTALFVLDSGQESALA